jgi:hypothetical protein
MARVLIEFGTPALTPGRFLVFISVTGGVDPRIIVRLQGLGQLKNLITSSEYMDLSLHKNGDDMEGTILT